MKLILLGKPLSGKGTQAEMLSKKLRVPVFSLGEILRREFEKKTALGRKAEKYMERGALVPETIILPLVKKHLPRKSFILDGFPRDLAQARYLETLTPLDIVIDVHCSNALIRKRTLARRSCTRCGKIYGLDVKEEKKGFCSCGGHLERRKDDTVATVTKRLETYEKQTAPLITFYKKKKLYRKVSGERKIAFVQKEILGILKSERIK